MHAHIQALFYAEFDNVQGPKIVYQTPEGFLGSLGASVPPADLPSSPVTQRLQQQQGEAPGPEDTDGPLAFDSISEYIIPKPELCGRLVTIFLNAKYKVLGYPVLLEGPKYERNNLLFNLCFVFERHDSTGEYEQVVRKIARELQNLEVCGSRWSAPLIHLMLCIGNSWRVI